MEVREDKVIGEIVAHNYKTALVFKKNKIDFCCNGNQTVKEACDKKNVNVENLIKELNNVLIIKQNEFIDFNTWELDLLIDYIEKTHHRYVSTKINEITPFLNKLVKVHGDKYPYLKEVEMLFEQTSTELINHMKKEENILFPYIKELVNSKLNQEELFEPHFKSVVNPIFMMKNEHQNEGERFEKISELTNNFTPVEGACNTHKITYELLKEFQENLHQHIHLENNILFPKSILLEESILNKQY